MARSADDGASTEDRSTRECVGGRPVRHLDEDELWAVHTALSATVECITSSDADVQLIMDLQEEAQELVASVLEDDASSPALQADSHHGVVLTGLSIDGLQVLAVPRETAVAELRTAALLAKASTFGELRQDADAAALVEQHLQEYRDSLLDSPELADVEDEPVEETLDQLVANDAAYDVWSVFSADDQLAWQAHAEARVSTADWLVHDLPFLLETYGHYDEGDGPTYLRATWIAAEDRDDFELDLRALGYDVQHSDGLHELYLDPPLNVDELLPGEAPA